MSSDRRSAHLQNLNWDDLAKRLLQHVQCRLGTRGTPQDAEDIAQAAIGQLLDPNYGDWNPERNPSPLRYLGSVANGLVANFVRRKKLHAEKQAELKAQIIAAPPRTPEQILSAKQQAQHVKELLVQRLSKDPVCAQIVRLTFEEDVNTANEQADRIGCALGDVYNARRRLLTHYKAVKAVLQSEERLPDAKEDPSEEIRS